MAGESTDLQHGAVITRDAHVALRELKTLIDLATNEIHDAEIEAVGLAIGHAEPEASRRKLLAVADMLHSPKFETTVQRALSKLEKAVAWHSLKQKAAHSG